ncbi:MAG TPA: peptidase M28, partial [Sediminibacterium sp.]
MNMYIKSLCLLALSVVSLQCIAQKDPLLKKYYENVRGTFHEKNAYNTVAFVEQRWRIAGNTGFNESIWYVEDILKKAGYVNEKDAGPSSMLTYRIEKRPMRRPTWEPVDATVEIIGDPVPLLSFRTNRNMLAINSGSTPPEGVEAELVYIEKPTKDDLEKLDLKGKFFFAEQPISVVYRAAMAKGALGALGYALPAYTQPQKHIHSIQFSSV